MKSELIVDVQPREVSIALLEDSRLVSLQKEARNISYAVGNIYLAKVKKLMPGLNASFVNVGYEKDAFLHYLDLGPRFATYCEFMKQLLDDKKKIPSLSKMKMLPDIDKNGSVSDVLNTGQELMVQIVKEPISSKGPRLTTEITFTGRYLVLIPFSDKISISQKIKTTEEKVRLRQLIDSIKPKNFGVIVRTSAEGKRVAELNNELKTLLKCWEDAISKAQKATAPALIFEEECRIVGMLRDVFSPSFESIHVNDKDTFTQIEKYVSLIAPERDDIVKLYSKPEPIFDSFAITKQIKSSFGKTVSFKSGAYIIIEHTEALHVIDVNSGNRTKATADQESNALEVNLRAADEIVRQLRLRDMGGIIVIDFIDMNKNEHRQQLYEHMKEIMANDRARHNILPLSKFGLMQITRQRVRPALDITTTEKCPSCFGKGEVQPSLLFTDTLYEKLEYVVNELGLKNFLMYVHPFVDAYLKKGWFSSMASKWKRRLGGKFKIIPDQSLAYLEYRVIDSEGNILDLKQEKDMNSSSTEKTAQKAAKRGGGDDEYITVTSNKDPDGNFEDKPAKKKSKKRKKSPKTDSASTDQPAQTSEETKETVAATEEPTEISVKADDVTNELVNQAQTLDDKSTAAPAPTDSEPAQAQKPKEKKARKPKQPKPVKEEEPSAQTEQQPRENAESVEASEPAKPTEEAEAAQQPEAIADEPSEPSDDIDNSQDPADDSADFDEAEGDAPEGQPRKRRRRRRRSSKPKTDQEPSVEA
jgi:ribonuclease G